MRKLLVILFAVFFALQGAGSMARDHGPCCEGCYDLLACASTSCTSCSGQVPDMQAAARESSEPGTPIFPEPLRASGRLSFEIWKPPR